uniref:Aminotransferase-like plant mobile domain-containing protein n=1 Tax=Fagus sylvatica TaxID=28930 RepID=A0A2N9FU31_FAGSY
MLMRNSGFLSSVFPCTGLVPWDSPVRHFRVIFVFLDFWVELGFRGRFLNFEPGSRLLGHPAGGRSILITSYRTPPYKIVSDSIFDLRVDFRVSGRSPVVGPKSSITGPPKTFLIGDFLQNGPSYSAKRASGSERKGSNPRGMGKRAVGIPNGYWRVIITRQFPSYLSHAPPSNQQPFFRVFSPLSSLKISPFFPFLSLLGPWPPQRMTMPTSWGSLASFPLSCGYKLIVACSRLLLLSGTRPIVAFPSGRWILFPTLEEYAELLQLDSPFSETPVIPIQGPRSNRCLEKYLGLTTAVLRPEIARPEETWRKANISLDLLTKYFSRSDFPVELARDFIAGKKGMEEIPNQCLQDRLRRRQGEGVPDVLHTAPSALHFPSPGNSRDWALYLLDLALEWVGLGRSPWGPAVWMPWTHCALFDGVPLPGVWGCTGYYPSLALRQFGGVQYPPRLGDLDAVTFDYIPSEDMWRLLFRIEDIWGGHLSEIVLIEEVRPGAPYSLVSRSLRVSASTGQPERVTVLERELEEARAELLSLRLARASEREASAARVESLRSTLHHNSVAVANLRRDLEAQRGNLEETLAETREQLETEQAERTRVQDELDSLRSYTQALVDPATGRPQDIVALRRALDASEEALTSARTSMGAMRVQISVLQALHQINQVMDSLGARARAVLEEHDEGDPALSTALGRFCRETCIRLGH